MSTLQVSFTATDTLNHRNKANNNDQAISITTKENSNETLVTAFPSSADVPTPKEKSYRVKNDSWYCNTCMLYCNSDAQFEVHLISQKHRIASGYISEEDSALLKLATLQINNKEEDEQTVYEEEFSSGDSGVDSTKDNDHDENDSYSAFEIITNTSSKLEYSLTEISLNPIASKCNIDAIKYLIPEHKKTGKFEKFGFYCGHCNAYMTGQIQLIMHVKGAKHQHFFPQEVPGYTSNKSYKQNKFAQMMNGGKHNRSRSVYDVNDCFFHNYKHQTISPSSTASTTYHEDDSSSSSQESKNRLQYPPKQHFVRHNSSPQSSHQMIYHQDGKNTNVTRQIDERFFEYFINNRLMQQQHHQMPLHHHQSPPLVYVDHYGINKNVQCLSSNYDQTAAALQFQHQQQQANFNLNNQQQQIPHLWISSLIPESTLQQKQNCQNSNYTAESVSSNCVSPTPQNVNTTTVNNNNAVVPPPYFVQQTTYIPPSPRDDSTNLNPSSSSNPATGQKTAPQIIHHQPHFNPFIQFHQHRPSPITNSILISSTASSSPTTTHHPQLFYSNNTSNEQIQHQQPSPMVIPYFNHQHLANHRRAFF